MAHILIYQTITQLVIQTYAHPTFEYNVQTYAKLKENFYISLVYKYYPFNFRFSLFSYFFSFVLKKSTSKQSQIMIFNKPT